MVSPGQRHDEGGQRRAKAINETAQTIINSARVGVDYAKVTGKDGTELNSLPPGVTVRTHRLR